MTWIETTAGGVLLHLKVQARAKETKVVGLYGNPPRLKIKLAALPVEGEANRELLFFLKKTLGITQSQLKMIRGAKSSQKDILCIGLSIEVGAKLFQDHES